MLIEFRVENHRSLREEQVFTMAATRQGGPTDERPRDIVGHAQPLLPAAVLYGANASGKSNVLSAMAFMREAVLHSHRLWEPDSGVPRSPFAWGDQRSEPSTFEVTFLARSVKHQYGFTVSDREVQEEWLFAWPSGRKQVWFEREGERFKFGDHLHGPNEVIREVTRPNALYLSVAAQHRHEQLAAVYSWFQEVRPIVAREGRYARPPSLLGIDRYLYSSLSRDRQQSLFPLESDESAAVNIQDLLKAADTGIVDIKLSAPDDDTPGPFSRVRRRILLKHQHDDEDSWLDLADESQGTQTLLNLAIPILHTLRSGGLLCVDELESSLHPLLGMTIVKLFNERATNPKHAQLVFTTHDTNLLGTTFGEPPLRRDQIWFTEKDKQGASKLYPLTDFKPRNVENLERGYLQGRYGAIPFVGDMSWITE